MNICTGKLAVWNVEMPVRRASNFWRAPLMAASNGLVPPSQAGAGHVLAAHLANFHPAMALLDRPEGRTRFDRLQLFGIADQDDLGADLRCMGQHAFQLPSADHAGFVDDKHIAHCEQVATLAPAVFQAGNGAGGDARSAFEVFGGNA